MISFKLMVLLISVTNASLYKTTHAEFIELKSNNATNIKNIENKTVEINKELNFNNGLTLDKALAQLNGSEAFNKPKIRKVTTVDNASLERKSKNEEKDKSVNSTKTVISLPENKILTEGGGADIKISFKNVTNNSLKPITSNQGSSNKTDANLTDLSKVVTKQNASISNDVTAKAGNFSSANISTSEAKLAVASKATRSNVTSNLINISNSNGKSNSSSTIGTTSSTSMTTSTATTTTTTTTTTPKPKKPTITYSVPDFPDLEKDNPELKHLLQSSSSNKLPIPDGPYAQPSQEFNTHFHRGRDFILPIVSMMFIIPLVIGIIITSYRRFRDCWSTRHYRRMDFLVDGMYND